MGWVGYLSLVLAGPIFAQYNDYSPNHQVALIVDLLYYFQGMLSLAKGDRMG